VREFLAVRVEDGIVLYPDSVVMVLGVPPEGLVGDTLITLQNKTTIGNHLYI
jgi:hypothetical protein